MKVIVFVSMLLPAVLACGTTAPAIDASRAAPPVTARPAEQPETLDPIAVAKSVRTPRQCEEAARAIAGAERAFTLLSACAARPDFDDIRPLLREPWLSELRRRGLKGLKLVARVAARREDMTVDLGLLRDQGISIHTLQHDEPTPEQYEGHVVMFRGFIEQRGGSTLIARELRYALRQGLEPYVRRSYDSVWIEQRWADPQDKKQLVWRPSGRELRLSRVADGCALGEEHPQMILMKVLELRIPSDAGDSDPGETNDKQARGRAELIGCFPVP